MPDLTTTNYFEDFIGSFWSRVFTDRGLTDGVAAVSVQEILQNYQRFVETLERFSIFSAKPSVLELVRPIVFRRSQFSLGPDYLVEGGGQVFGPQPDGGKFRAGAVFAYGGLEKRAGNYYIGVDDQIVDVGPVIMNSLVNPSLVWTKGVDFILQDGVLVFKNDPFADGRIPKRHVFSDSVEEGEEEIVLWMTNVTFDRGEFSDQFGFIAPEIKPGDPNYFRGIKSCIEAVSAGPTISAIDNLLASLMGLPAVVNARETVESIVPFGENTIVGTDLNAYVIPPGFTLRAEVVVGATLEVGHPLTTATQVFDKNSRSEWWRQIDGMVLSEAFFGLELNAALGFENKVVPLELGDPETSPYPTGWRSATFHLAGKPADVEKFWARARQAGLDQDLPIGNAIYKQLGYVDGNGDPDFTKAVFVNPLEFLAQQLIGDSVIIAKVEVPESVSLQTLFHGMAILRRVVPPHLGLVILLNVPVSDEVSFYRTDPGGVSPTGLVLENTAKLLKLPVNGGNSLVDSTNVQIWEAVDDLGLKTPTPELLSMDYSPDRNKETISFGDPAENADAYGGSVAACRETIESAQISVCKH